jgi:O-antigen/teichoic acid export membrane protein
MIGIKKRIAKLLSLKKQTVNGAIWTFVDLMLNKGTYLAATILLAKILGPTEFGLIGMISIFVAIGNSLIDSGLTTSLLRLKKVSQTDYTTVFFSSILMSLLVYSILYLSANIIAKFYNQQILVDLIRIYCLGFIISSFRGVQAVKLIKELDFKKITMLNIPGNIISTILAIYMGYNGFGVWSLVALFLTNQIISTIVYWSFVRWRPSLTFDFECYKFHVSFGYKLVISAQLNTIFENIYNIIIGKYFSVQMLGFYERAYAFNNYPTSIISGIIQKISLPSLTIVKDNSVELKNVYKNMMIVTFFFSIVILSFLSIVATPLFTLLLGNAWSEMIPLFRVLTLSFILYPIHSLNVNILSVFGRSDIFLKLEIYKKILTILVVVGGLYFGVMGLVWGNVFLSIFALFLNTYFGGKFINYSTLKQLRDLVPTVAIVIFTCSIVMLMNVIFKTDSNIWKIIYDFLTGLIVLTILCEMFKLAPYIFIKKTINEMLSK